MFVVDSQLSFSCNRITLPYRLPTCRSVCMFFGHSPQHAFHHSNVLRREGLSLVGRRNLLKAGLAGVAGLSLPALLRQQASAAQPARTGRSLILLWMTGGPSHIDT